MKTGDGLITQYTHAGEILTNAREAFDTAHHEGTHLVQPHEVFAHWEGEKISAAIEALAM